jgi:ubiquinone biosynthesis protein UbiJ
MKQRRFDSLKSVRRFLAEVITELDEGKINDTRARSFAILAAAIRDCLAKDQLEELEARLAALEEETR